MSYELFINIQYSQNACYFKTDTKNPLEINKQWLRSYARKEIIRAFNAAVIIYSHYNKYFPYKLLFSL